MPDRCIQNRFGIPFKGFGLGLRTPHLEAVLAGPSTGVDWFEIIAENYMAPHRWSVLDALRDRYPFFIHGVGLSIGSTDPLDEGYVAAWTKLVNHVNPVVVSDHLCWTGVAGTKVHDLLPMVYTPASLQRVADRIKAVQDRLGRVLALENPSTYLEWEDSTLSEAEFLAQLSETADCALLLDVNNVVVSAANHRLDVNAYLATLPRDRVVQMHLAGHQDFGTHRIDTHDSPIIDEVFRAYQSALRRFGPVSTMIERDANIPPLQELLDELGVVKQQFERIYPSSSVA